MPTFVKSAMNPSGMWQEDGLDQPEQANRAFQEQARGRDLQSQLALAQLQNQRYGLDQMAGMTRENWGREDQRRSGEYDKAIALARIAKEPNDLERLKFERDGKFDDLMLSTLGGRAPGTQAPGPNAMVDPPRHEMPNAPIGGMSIGQRQELSDANAVYGQVGARPIPTAYPGSGVAGFPADALRQIAIISALRNRQSLPDFTGQDMRNEATELELSDRRRNSARSRMQTALDNGDLDGARRIAEETGESMPVGQIEDFMASNPDLTSDLARMTSDFVKRDASMFGWNPTEDDQAAVRAELDRVVQILVSRGFRPDAAMAEAKRVVRLNLGPDAQDINAGHTSALRQSIGL